MIYKNIDLVDDRRALDIGSQTNITLGRLGKFSHYSVKVAARTSKGVGKTGEIKVWTKQDSKYDTKYKSNN